MRYVLGAVLAIATLIVPSMSLASTLTPTFGLPLMYEGTGSVDMFSELELIPVNTQGTIRMYLGGNRFAPGSQPDNAGYYGGVIELEIVGLAFWAPLNLFVNCDPQYYDPTGKCSGGGVVNVTSVSGWSGPEPFGSERFFAAPWRQADVWYGFADLYSSKLPATLFPSLYINICCVGGGDEDRDRLLIVNGMVEAVPEPTTLFLFGGALTGAGLRRRRRVN